MMLVNTRAVVRRFAKTHILDINGLRPGKSIPGRHAFFSAISWGDSQQESNPPSNGRDDGPINPAPNFDDVRAAYETKRTKDLVVAAGAFGLCRSNFLVRNAEPLLMVSRQVLGDRLTDWILKQTLFGHFCAGEDEEDMQPSIQNLEKHGIGTILDFVAEDGGGGSMNVWQWMHKYRPNSAMAKLYDRFGSHAGSSDATTPAETAETNTLAEDITSDLPPKVRVYDYTTESDCDRHVDTFLSCINHASHLPRPGFAAVKVTALGNPQLLERMSAIIVETQNLFRKFDKGNDGYITKDEFEEGYKYFFNDDPSRMHDLMEQVVSTEGKIDYISWTSLLQPRHLPRLLAGCRHTEPLAGVAPDQNEIELMERMFERAHALGQEASRTKTRLLIDAEQVRFQPAIDNLVLDLQRRFNATDTSDFPIIYNTYQCYLKDTREHLATDVARSERFQYHLGAKLVRGAYMESERELAAQQGYPSPIHDTLQDTHDCYNGSVRFLLEHAAKEDTANKNNKTELMLATHNQESVEKAIQVMNELGIDRHDFTVSFASLYGMMDNLTFHLGKCGYRAYKYVPYGEVKLAMPYLLRRANENSSIAGSAGREFKLISGLLPLFALPESMPRVRRTHYS